MSPRSSTISLNPPAVPSPSMGGALKTLISPPRDFSAEGRLQPAGNHVVGKPLSDAGMKIVEHQVHRAEVGGVGVEQNRLAGNRHRVLDARRFVGDLFDPLHDLLRALHGGRVGKLHVDQQVAFVLRRNESFGRRLKAAVGQNQAGRHKPPGR